MLYQRLQKANKIAAKRWLKHHEHSFNNQPTGFGIGVYRKRKGCDCRACSARNQEVKRARNKKERRYEQS